MGDGGLADRLRRQAEALSLGGRVRFPGAAPGDGIAGDPAGCMTLEVDPGGPVVVMDATAMRPPAFMFDDPVSLAMAIAIAVDDEHGAAMGRYARQRIVERFAIGATSRALSAVF